MLVRTRRGSASRGAASRLRGGARRGVPEIEVIGRVGPDQPAGGLERQLRPPEQHHPAVPAQDPQRFEPLAHGVIIAGLAGLRQATAALSP
jgi:hypothetical protein